MIAIHVLLMNSVMYVRMFLPIILQFFFAIGLHINKNFVASYTGDEDHAVEWFQIGNLIFYVLMFISGLSFIAILLLVKLRKNDLGEG